MIPSRIRSTRFTRLAVGRARLPVVGRVAQFIQAQSPGDRFIALVLLAALAVTSTAGTLAAIRSFQVAVPAYGGTLDEGVIGRPRFPNPLIAATDADRDIVALTYAGLMGYGADGSLIPVLADSYTRSDDGLVYTFTLREGVRFSDGTPVGTDSILTTIRLVQNPDLKSPLLSAWEDIRVEPIDARTVRFTLPQPYAPFLEQATMGILPAHLWRAVEAAELPFSPYTVEPVGAGPFSLDRVIRTRDGKVSEYRFSAFEGYALGRPFLNHVHLSFFDDTAALSEARATGRISSAYGIPGPAMRAAPFARVFGVFFNTAQSPSLEDGAVREALSIAIDRDGIVSAVFGGFATPLNGPLPPAARATDDVDGVARVDEARTLLIDAGWAQDTATQRWQKDGQELAVTLITSTVPELTVVAERVRADWSALGVPTELVFSTPGELVQTVIRPRAFEALLFGEVIGTAADLYPFWASTEREDPGLNITQFGDPTTDALLARLRAGTTSDIPTLAADVEARIAAAYPAAFLYTPDFLYSLPASFNGIPLRSIEVPSDRFRGIHAWYRATQYVWPAFVPEPRS